MKHICLFSDKHNTPIIAVVANTEDANNFKLLLQNMLQYEHIFI